MNNGDLNEEFGDVIHNTILEVQMSVGESGELFIFRTIKPFCEEVLSREISKKELKEMLLKAERMKWIPCSERLPDDGDCRDYLVLVENHIEDAPMICQCDPYYGFGYYREIFDPVSLGHVDTEFNTLEELNYDKALYWMQLPEPPYEKEE